MNYSEAIQLLLALPDLERKNSGPLAKSMSLESMKELLSSLQDPHLNRRTIHVTGSKGKGSTSAFIAGFLHAAGFSTALYTSPHLHDFTERICFNLAPVERSTFATAVEAIAWHLEKSHSGGPGPISTFGAMTALFFWLAKNVNVDWQIVEVGMGGAFDATNVFARKDVAVITAISLEHTAALGQTAAAIAQNKAGIITEGTTVVLAPQVDPAVVAVIEDRCKSTNSSLVDVSKMYRIEDLGPIIEQELESASSAGFQRCTINGQSKTRTLQMRMSGRHQQSNLATAVAVIDALSRQGETITDRCLIEGARHVFVPGRIERLLTAPQLVVDGAHNEESARVLADALRRHFRFDRCILVLGVNADKNISEIIQALHPVSDILIATKSSSEKAMSPETIAEVASKHGCQCRIQPDTPSALKNALAEAGPYDLICVTGSLYLVGEAREFCGFSSPASLWQVAPEILQSH